VRGIHLALNEVSVAFEGCCLPLPSFNFAFYHERGDQDMAKTAHSKIGILLLLLFGHFGHVGRAVERMMMQMVQIVKIELDRRKFWFRNPPVCSFRSLINN